MIVKTILGLVTAFALVGFTSAQEVTTPEVDLAGIKCIVSGKEAASPDAFVEYKDGKVYFCCEKCAAAFKEDVKQKEDAKYTVKANHQLVLTGQYVQKGCPMSGGPVDKNLTAKVGATTVGFCCAGCQSKVDGAEDLEAKSELVFSNVAFKKAFEKKSEVDLKDVMCLMMPTKNVVAEQSVDYAGGKVYFCCKNCVKKFNSDPEKFAAQANQQLVATGQFVQTGCPISGGKLNEEQSSKVNGVAVKFCCEKCKAKVDGAEGEAQADLVFGKKAFEKGFAKASKKDEDQSDK